MYTRRPSPSWAASASGGTGGARSSTRTSSPSIASLTIGCRLRVSRVERQLGHGGRVGVVHRVAALQGPVAPRNRRIAALDADLVDGPHAQAQVELLLAKH